MRRKQDHAASAEDWTTIPLHKHEAIDALIEAIEVMQAEIEELETRVKILETNREWLGGKK